MSEIVFNHLLEKYKKIRKENIQLEAEIAKLREAIEEVQQTQDMLYDEHYDLQAWRENHVVTEQIFQKALEGK